MLTLNGIDPEKLWMENMKIPILVLTVFTCKLRFKI